METKQFFILIMAGTVYKQSLAQSCDLSHIPELTLRVASPYSKSNKEQTYRLVGLFPALLKSKFNNSGFVWIEVAKFAFLELLKMFHESGLTINLELVIFDSCNKIDIASMHLLDLLLQRPNKSATISDCCNQDSSSKVIGFIGPSSSSTTNHVLKLLSFDHYPVISYSSTSARFNDKILYPTFLRTIPPDNLQARLILDLVLHYNWTYVSIVAQDNEYGRMGMNELNKLFVENKICTSIETVYNEKEKNSMLEILEQMNNDPLSNAIILWASIKATLAFLKETAKHNLHNKIFILGEDVNENPEVLKTVSEIVHGVLSVVPDSGRYSSFEENFRTMTHADHAADNPWLNAFFEDHLGLTGQVLNESTIDGYWDDLPRIKNGNVYNAVFAFGHAIKDFIEDNPKSCSKNNTENCLKFITRDRINFIKNYLQVVKFNDLQQRPVTFDEEGNLNSTHYIVSSPQFLNGKLQWKRVGKWNKRTGLKITQQFLWAYNTTVAPLSRCGSVCAPGYTHHGGSKDCCWQCILCEGNAVKLKIGQGLCIRCPRDTYTNKEHTECLQLKQIYLHYTNTAGYILILVGLLNTCIIIIFTGAFIKYRKTHVVISSQLTLSFMQLFFLGLLNFTPLMSFGKIDDIKCILYGFTTPFLVTFAIVPTILKIQRLVTVFEAKVILRHKHGAVVSKEITIRILALISIQAVIVVISYTLSPYQEKVTQIDVPLLEIQTGCSFKLLFYMEIIYLLLILLVCGIFAFRARELPTNYNETKVIAFAMFTCSVILTFVFPLYESISDVLARNVVMNLTFLLMDTMILNFMYAPKIWIILFRPNLNTNKHFIVSRLRQINSEIASRYEKRLSSDTPKLNESIDHNGGCK